MTSSRKYALIGAVSAMLFCLSVGVLIRSCEMARLARAEVVSFAELRLRLAEIQRSSHAVSAPR